MKYKLTKKTKEHFGVILYQIEALKDFGNVSKGDKGGYIEKVENLAWVSGDAWVYGNAEVSGNAEVYGDAWVSGDAWVYGNAKVYGNAEVYGELKLIGGYFYHTKESSKEIEKVDIDEHCELLCSEPELEEENDEVEIVVEGKKKVISRKSAKALNLI